MPSRNLAHRKRLEFIPTETHKFVQQDRQGRRRGRTGLLFKKNIDVKKIDSGERTSIEFSEWRVTYTSYLMNSARRDYFSNLITENSSNQRKLFRIQPICCYLSRLMSRFQITYLLIIWLIILATILYRRLNISMTHLIFRSEPLDGDDDTSTDNMGTRTNCVDPGSHKCAEFPNFKTLTQDQVSLIIGKAAIKSCL